ncbi:MAG: peptide deformylase [Chitinophagales bacterium]|nr:peptide deformylase [Chitinophagales bacterium]
MILPIYAFGQPVLKKKANPVELDGSKLKPIISDMFETMYHCKGVGLAAPQVGLSIRLFIIDSSKVNDDDERKDKSEEGLREVFINAEMIEENGGLHSLEEGCLSIPNIYGHVEREKAIKIRYYDAQLELNEKVFTGFTARVIQHEYDHIEGILFIEKLKPLKKQMIKRKLEDIKKGDINCRYKMKFA